MHLSISLNINYTLQPGAEISQLAEICILPNKHDVMAGVYL
jgi:hypothetical protein